MKRKTVNKAIVLSTAAAMAAGSTTIGVLADSVTATSVKKDTIKDQTAVNILKPKSGYTYLSSVASAAKQDNIVTVAYENGEKAQDLKIIPALSPSVLIPAGSYTASSQSRGLRR